MKTIANFLNRIFNCFERDKIPAALYRQLMARTAISILLTFIGIASALVLHEKMYLTLLLVPLYLIITAFSTVQELKNGKIKEKTVQCVNISNDNVFKRAKNLSLTHRTYTVGFIDINTNSNYEFTVIGKCPYIIGITYTIYVSENNPYCITAYEVFQNQSKDVQ